MRIALGAAALAIVALAAAVLTSAMFSRGDPDTTLDEAVADALQFIETHRGLELTRGVPLSVLDDADFTQSIEVGSDFSAAEVQLLAAQERALGISAPNSLQRLLGEANDTQILGLYEPLSRRILVRDVPVDVELQSTIIHELVHAAQDQHHGPLSVSNLTSDAALARTVVIEGDAERVANLWQLTQPASSDVSGEPFITELPLGVLVYGSLPYVLGPMYIETVSADGNTAIDAILDSPPITSAATLRPWVDWSDVPELVGPPFDAELEFYDDRGAAMLLYTLAAVIDDDLAWNAAAAWGADAFWVEANNAEVCVTWEVRPRLGHEAALRTALAAYADALQNAHLADDYTVVSCDPGESASLVTPAQGVDTFIRITEGLRLLHWMGDRHPADCIISLLLDSGQISEAAALADPGDHRAFIAAEAACTA